VAAFEAALALRDLAGDSVSVELRSPRRDFIYRPFAVGEPFGLTRMVRHDLPQLAERCGASFSLGGLLSVDTDARQAISRDGSPVSYDHLLLAPGARMLWAVPGAVTFWGVADEGGVGNVIRKIRAGSLRRVAFTLPGGHGWPLPAYELSLLAASVLARSGVNDAQLTVVTPEEAPLLIFGRQIAEQMGELLEERGIDVVTGAHPVEFDDGLLRVSPGDPVEAEAVISLPRLEGRRIDGVPHDLEGFVHVDPNCRVEGVEHVFAAGDVTSFPVKQGGIATQQADAAAAAIAADAGCEVEAEPFEPIMRSVLWTGDGPRYLLAHLAGGRGETSELRDDPPWPAPDGKIIARYLSGFLTPISNGGDLGASVGPPSKP
jgi:sulfide:quinone oxidoreductase